MDERVNVWVGAGIGALVGAAAGYLFFTGRGARVRRELAARVGEASDHLARVQGLAAQVREASSSGLATVSRLFTDATRGPGDAGTSAVFRPDLDPGPRPH